MKGELYSLSDSNGFLFLEDSSCGQVLWTVNAELWNFHFISHKQQEELEAKIF